MTLVRIVVRDLVERRLWPVALLLVAALVAVPVVLGRDGEPAASPATLPTTGGVVAGDDEEATKAEVSLDASAPVLRDRPGATRNPFKRPASAKKKKTPAAKAAPASPAAGGGSSTPELPAAPSVPSTPDVPSAGGSGSGSSGSGSSGSGSSGSRSDAKPTLHVTVRFGTTGDQRTIRDIARLSPLPSADDPFFVFLGVLADGETAVFMVSSDATPTGAGRCRPSAATCETIELKAGDTEWFDLTAPDGSVTQYQMDVVSIRKKRETSSEAIRAAYARHSRVGAELLRDAAVHASPAAAGARRYRYLPKRGVLVRARKRAKAASSAAADALVPGAAEALALAPRSQQPGVAVWHSAPKRPKRAS